ncbi:MAG: ABC transporter ATP-binding protein [Spirochaetota bacterium]|nr:ABC transporter ATP-binding protein [Spirochaetota bacterium]
MIQLHEVHKSYSRGPVKIPVLVNCQLTVEKGEFLMVMGPSGSGKSTLLNLVGGIDTADSGVVTVNDKQLDSMKDKELTLFRRENIGIIFQFFNLIPTLSAVENVALPLLLDGAGFQKASRKAQELLGLVKLDAKKDHKPEELSGGEMQRVAIARALICEPSVILADEPTGNLDSQSTAEILGLLKSVAADGNHTVLFVTHNTEIAHQGDRLIKLKDGKIDL